MTEEIVKMAYQLWDEQYRCGVVPDRPDMDKVAEWLINRTYPLSMLVDAYYGDVEAMAYVRSEAGLSVL
jgi:hypothetical protein